MIPIPLLIMWAIGFMNTGARLMIIDKPRQPLEGWVFLIDELFWLLLMLWLTLSVI